MHQQACPGPRPYNGQGWQVAAAQAAKARNWPLMQRIARDWTVACPVSPEAWQALSRACFERSRFAEAMAAFDSILALEPGEAKHWVSAARLATAAQDYETARAHLDRAQCLAPDSGEVLYALCRLYHLTGELDLAEAYCRRAIAVRPQFAPAFVTLSLLREGRLDQAEIDTMSHLVKNPRVHPEYRAMLCFALGDALDFRGDCAAAFSAWDAANQISRGISEQENIKYRREQHEGEVALLEALFAEPLTEPAMAGKYADKPKIIFVVGMPRSGTTLIESILASHSEVEGVGELPALQEIHEELLAIARGQGIESARDTLSRQARPWRLRYLEAIPFTDSSGRTTRWVVDKQPLNYRAIGLIRVLFPESPIIYAQRSAVDVGFSIYRHNFSKNWPCAHRLADIGHYYGIHSRIAALWQQRYAGAIHIAKHAAIVSDSQAEIRRLLDFTGLPFEPACLAPHKTKRPIATFSSVQVRRPVSARYSGRAAHYTSWLAPLIEALQSTGIKRGIQS